MYIEFRLPEDVDGWTINYVNSLLNRNLHDWSDQYNVPYNKKIHKLTVRITFDDEKLYDFFALTWRPKGEDLLNYLTEYRFIEPMRRV